MDLVTDGAKVLLDHWILTVILALTFFLTFDYISTFGELKRLGIKGPTPLPILGNFVQIMLEAKGLHIYLQELTRKYGKVAGFYLLRSPVIVVYDPEISKAIFVKEFDKFHDRPLAAMEKGEPLSNAITSLKGQKWKDVRRILSPTFTAGKIKDMIFIMHEAADSLLDKIGKAAKEQEAFDIHDWQQTVTMEVILSIAFGVRTNAQTDPNDRLMKLARNAMGSRELTTLVAGIPVIGTWLSQKLANSEYGLSFGPLADFASKIIEQRKGHESQRKDMLNMMLAAQDPDNNGRKLTEKEIVAQMILFIIAGYDTSGNVLALTCHHLAIYPEIQEKVFEEIKDVCSLPDTCTYDEISKMPYLEACISETLRLYPPGFIVGREVTESCMINGIYFKKGTAVFIPIYSFHHDEVYFPDPETYKPERFLPENKGSVKQYTYMPFGVGPRNCIGMRMALMEMKVILVRMLQKYRLVRCPETKVPLSVKPKLVLAPTEPVMIRADMRLS